ncbi:MAG: hypothetical protein IPO66_20700 [Rhodanobacteraceae bacterium]|nr:hypothetical protein [Rhodanobacteraceae bacterium]
MSRGSGAASVRPAEGLAGALTGVLLFLALLLGGGTRNYLFTDLLVQLLAAVLLIYGLARLRWRDLDTAHRQLFLLVALVLALPLLQLVPLPGVLIQWLPGRSQSGPNMRSLVWMSRCSSPGHSTPTLRWPRCVRCCRRPHWWFSSASWA